MAQASPTMRTVLALIVVSALLWVQIQASPTAAAAAGEIERNAASKKLYGAADLMENALDETMPFDEYGGFLSEHGAYYTNSTYAELWGRDDLDDDDMIDAAEIVDDDVNLDDYDLDATTNTTGGTNATAAVTHSRPYTIDCLNYPDVCRNWCYYVFCHKKASSKRSPHFVVTVNRNAHNRRASACGLKPHNKCSTKSGGVWPPNPVPGVTCDEQPKNTNDEGGADAATMCMPGSENSGEGSRWSHHIATKADGGGIIPNGDKVRVELFRVGRGKGTCESYHRPGKSRCRKPADPNMNGVANDVHRQE